ncbi:MULTISPECIES: factor-independent urate hydroxylase [unclassified Pseudofrankia]|uniref:factor-independent urate hydroxylase n=1 Tax=unclassified Pseudofrankia TaxID=2994372 RepID=UPI0008D9E17E|nr:MULTISPECIES: urate oxidase [unclassified Pseudofrankia]MDT3442058.1 urate oxidase [Pseudofrankia sp. BMG5.37]OHV47287.1 urate oxidase [Pseudofrankia sp. BMG5.36]
MAIVLGPNQFGKAEVRLVHVDRSTPVHRITDLNVSSALRGDFADAHLTGDNAHILTTDAQKNTAYAFAREGVGEIEEFALRLGRHFTGSFDWVTGARVEIEQYGWDRIQVDGAGHDHAFSRAGSERRTTVVTVDGDDAYVVSGLAGLVVLKSTGSEFWGFAQDRYTTLAETDDRILATEVTAHWRLIGVEHDYGKLFASIRTILLETFASVHSLALQQTLYKMGEEVLTAYPEVAEIRMSMPNKHHFLVDLAPYGLDNPNTVFYAADRPYGKIEGTVLRDDAPDAGPAWQTVPGFR